MSRQLRQSLRINVRTGSGARQMSATLTYRTADPWAVHLEVGNRCWTFARELLEAGVRDHAGLGEVTVRPSDPTGRYRRPELQETSPAATPLVEIGVRDRGVPGHLLVPAADVGEFLSKTHSAVPAGGELDYLDPPLDDALAQLLAAGQPADGGTDT